MVSLLKNSFVLLAGLIIFSPVPILPAELPSTNEQFISNAIAEAVMAYFDSLQLAPSQVKVGTGDGLNNLAIDGVKLAMVKMGWSIINNRSQNNKYKFEINTALSALDFKYKKGKSRGFFKKPFIRRELTGQIILNISGSDLNHVSFVDFSDSDRVLPQQENYIASIRYKELAPPAPVGGVERYLEPLAVTATVGGLIYLFFINR